MNELVEAMLAAVPADGSSIGNQSLLEHLKIQFPHLRDEFYWQTREALIDQCSGLLIPDTDLGENPRPERGV
ncbi:TPA: hypothetical protein ACHH76_005485 [Pseudomonas aeruginosa]